MSLRPLTYAERALLSMARNRQCRDRMRAAGIRDGDGFKLLHLGEVSDVLVTPEGAPVMAFWVQQRPEGGLVLRSAWWAEQAAA